MKSGTFWPSTIASIENATLRSGNIAASTPISLARRSSSNCTNVSARPPFAQLRCPRGTSSVMTGLWLCSSDNESQRPTSPKLSDADNQSWSAHRARIQQQIENCDSNDHRALGVRSLTPTYGRLATIDPLRQNPGIRYSTTARLELLMSPLIERMPELA